MAKRRRTDRGTAAELDQVLLELFAGQLLLEPAAAKLPREPALHPAAVPSLARAKAKQGNRLAAAKPRIAFLVVILVLPINASMDRASSKP